MNRARRFATLATHVLDIRPIPNAAEDATGSKVTCEIEITDGGGGINVASQLQQMNEQVALVARVGQDDLGCVACSRLVRKFRDVLTIPVLPEHRLSILQQDHCYTNRPASRLPVLPKKAFEKLRAADTIVIAPLTQSDFPWLRDTMERLRPKCRIVLQLSGDQLQHADQSLQLMKLASVTILNDAEARRLTGQDRISRAIEYFQKHRAGNVVITSTTQADACLDGNYYIVPGFPAEHVVRTIGAGDTFTAHFTAAMSYELPWHQSLRLSLKAASDYVQGKTPASIRNALPDPGPQSKNSAIVRGNLPQLAASDKSQPLRHWTSILSATAVVIFAGLWMSLR